MSPVLGTQSLNHWTAREVLDVFVFNTPMIFILAILSASHRGILVRGRGKWKKLDTINGRRWVCSLWSLPRVLSPAERPAPWPRQILELAQNPKHLTLPAAIRIGFTCSLELPQ